MRHRLAKTLLFPTACLILPGSLLGTGSAFAQAGPTPIAPANFDPSDVYFQGYLLSRSAEQLETSGDFVGAAEKLKKARELFDAVQRYYPTWKSEMVTGRSAQNSEAEVRIHPKAEEQRKKNKDVVAELEGGQKNPGTLMDTAEGVMPLTPGILEVNPLETKRLAEAEAEVKRLRELAKAPPAPDPESSRDASRVRDLARQRDVAVGGQHALRYHPDISPFADTRDDSPEGLKALAELVPEQGSLIWLHEDEDPASPPGVAATTVTGVQMVAQALVPLGPTAPFEPLGEADAPAMLALAS